MSQASRNRRAVADAVAALIDAPSFASLDEPLEYILAVHGQGRCVCAALRAIARERSVGRSAADRIVAFLTRDIVIHHQDEEDDLFPALRQRAQPEDKLGAIIARLGDDHRHFDRMIDGIVDALSALPANDPLEIELRDAELMLAYAAGEHRHLAIENGIVLVIARKRLTPGDLSAMSRSMKARRGVHAA